MTQTAPNELEVAHEEQANRYVLRRAGDAIGTLAYRPVGRAGEDTVDVFSTNISPTVRGQGMGEVLVRAALDDMRSRRTSVMASCWYVADFLDAHADYQDLRPGADRPVARQANPEDTRATPTAAGEAHDHGVSDTGPMLADGGAPAPDG
ncbi:MAG: GNAT family N-acetyltransferase [Acidimicrobiia bacterium]